MTRHFRHKSDSACVTGYETALHQAAKEFIAEEVHFSLPVIRAEHSEQDALGNLYELFEVLIPVGNIRGGVGRWLLHEVSQTFTRSRLRAFDYLIFIQE